MKARARATGRSLLRVRVVPRAARAALTLDARGTLRAHVTAPPVEGAANRALLALLAARLGLPARTLALTHGVRGRDKVVAVEGTSARELAERVRRAVASSVDKGQGGG